MSDLISRQAAINLICEEGTRLERNGTVAMVEIKQWCVDLLEDLPSVEPLTDIEQRIFLAAMVREEGVCMRTDNEFPGDVNLVCVCNEIERKVRKALWGT